jgi:transposase
MTSPRKAWTHVGHELRRVRRNARIGLEPIASDIRWTRPPGSRSASPKLHKLLPEILSSNTDVLSPKIVSLVADLAQDWRRLDERIAAVSAEIEALAQQDDSSRRLMSVPGIGPITSSAMVAAISNGAGFKQGRDFGAWLELVPSRAVDGNFCRLTRLVPMPAAQQLVNISAPRGKSAAQCERQLFQLRSG